MNRPRKSREVSLGRASIHEPLGSQLLALHSPRLRSRVVAALLNEKAADGVDVAKLIAALYEVRSLGLLLNQSLRFSGGRGVDVAAATAAINLINSLRS